jgi:hypothetical protein
MMANCGLAVAVLQALQHQGGDAQHAVGQGAQVVGHLLHGDAAFDVARQGAEDLGMVGAAQQVEQGFVVVLARGCSGRRSASSCSKSAATKRSEHGVAGQLVDHAGVLLQVARGQRRRPADAAGARARPGAPAAGPGSFRGAAAAPAS